MTGLQADFSRIVQECANQLPEVERNALAGAVKAPVVPKKKGEGKQNNAGGANNLAGFANQSIARPLAQ